MKVIDFFVEKEVKLDVWDIEGCFLFLNVVVVGYIELVFFFYICGVDIYVIDFFMKNCVYIVVENEYLNVLGMFLDKCFGVYNLNKGDIFGRVFLYYVVIIENIKVFKGNCLVKCI